MSRAEGEVLANPETLEASECILDGGVSAGLAPLRRRFGFSPRSLPWRRWACPPAASQGEHEDAHIFNHIKVATYNVGASQDISFTAPGKMERFKVKLVVSRARLAVGPASTTQKAFREAGPIRREGPGPSRRGPSGGGTNVRSGLRPG